MVQIELGQIIAGGLSNNAGIFSGQNIQNSWDSHTPYASAFGILMGDADISLGGIAWFSHHSLVGMPTNDNDNKGNHSPVHIGR